MRKKRYSTTIKLESGKGNFDSSLKRAREYLLTLSGISVGSRQEWEYDVNNRSIAWILNMLVDRCNGKLV